jgi:hypothetical protein
MHNIINLFLFTLFYYQLDNILKPLVYDKFDIFNCEPIIFYPVIQTANIFILSIFSLFVFYLFIFSKTKNSNIFELSFIYIKYISDTIIHHNTNSIYQYEFRRTIMWCFTTPLILKIYGDINNLSLLDMNAQYHILSNLLHVLLYPFLVLPSTA